MSDDNRKEQPGVSPELRALLDSIPKVNILCSDPAHRESLRWSWKCSLCGVTGPRTLEAMNDHLLSCEKRPRLTEDTLAELDALHSVMRIQEQTWRRAEAILKKILMGHPYSLDEVRQAYDPIPKAAGLIRDNLTNGGPPGVEESSSAPTSAPEQQAKIEALAEALEAWVRVYGLGEYSEHARLTRVALRLAGRQL